MRILGSLLLLLAVFTAPLAAQDGDRSLDWNEITVQAHLDADGRLRVKERQVMVLTGDWNGGERRFDLRHGQHIEMHSLTRIEPQSGERVALTRAEPDDVDEYDWADGDLLRWRSRAQSAPPFDNAELTYELDYSIWPVLAPAGDGKYVLRHDFAFADRAGVIRHFEVDFTLDEAWATPFGNHIRESGGPLQPDRGYVLTVEMTHAEGEVVLAGAGSASLIVRAAVTAGAAAIPLILLVGLRRRDRDLDRIAPIVPPARIDADWLEREIFIHPAEVVGTAWDRAVGPAEVSALLARLVAEGRLASRVEPGEEDDDEPVLHLRRLAPLASFLEHERELLEALFFDDGDETDTGAIREHYAEKGFDPAAIIRKPLLEMLAALPGEGGLSWSWKGPALVMLVGALAIFLVPEAPGRLPIALVGIALVGTVALITLALADAFGKRVTARRGLQFATVLAITIPAVLLVAFALIPHSVDGPFGFYRPGEGILLGFLTLLAGLGSLTLAFSTPNESVERLGYRRRLVSARQYFQQELDAPEPSLRDDWFPYLLAFGLSEDVDRWFEVHESARTSGDPGAVIIAGAGSAGGSAGGWTGGGPQFGGGSFGGGGGGGGGNFTGGRF